MITSVGKRVYDLLNKQVTEYFLLSLIFLSMDGVFSNMGLKGCSAWARKRYAELRLHGLSIFDHIVSRGGKVRLGAIPAPKVDWRSPLHIFDEAIRLEARLATGLYAIADMAILDKDHATSSFIGRLVEMHTEKEAEVTALLEMLKKMQSSELGVVLFDANVAKMYALDTPSAAGISV